MWELYFILFCSAFTVQSSPPEIQPCKLDDTECIVKISHTLYSESVNGIPEWSIRPQDPIHIKELEGNLVTINYKLTNATISGFHKSRIVDAKWSLEKNKIELTFECPHLVVTGQYEMKGQLLGLDINGGGYSHIDSKDWLLVVDLDIKIIQGDDGKKYISLTKFRVQVAECRGGIVFDLPDLIKDNKKLSNDILSFLNQNWKAAGQVLNGPIFNTATKALIKNINAYFKHRPLETMVVLD